MISGKPGSALQLDGVTVGTVPIDNLEVAAGHHHLVARRRGYQTWERDMEVTPGSRLQLRPELVPTARRRAVRWTGLTAGLFGAAALASGIVWGAEYASAAAYYNRSGLRTMKGIDSFNQQFSTIEQARICTSISIAMGASLLITTLTLYWLD
jgi:hypothetical protein